MKQDDRIQKLKGNKPDSPCKDCMDRYLGCHSHCAEYQDFTKKIQDYNYALRVSRAETENVNNFKIQRCLDWKRKQLGKR